MATYTYWGTATFYNCSGTTACGDPCVPGDNSYHLAYPNVVGHSPDYSNKIACGGGGMVAAPCGNSPLITNLCNGLANNIPIGDHGPPPPATCRYDQVPCDPPGTYGVRRLDLTALAYQVMGGGPQGWIFCRIEVTV